MSFPLIPYTKSIPAAANNPSNDQPDMQANTDAIDTLLNRDHYPFNTNYSGLHRQSRYKAQTAPSTGVAGDKILALYAKTGAVSTELFMIRDANAGTEVALTTSKIGAPILNPLASVSWLPGGVLIQWGSTTAVQGSASNTIPYATPFPNRVLSVTCTVVTDDSSTIRFSILGNPSLGSFTTTQTNSSHFIRLEWMAIGD